MVGDSSVGGYRLILNATSTGAANHIKVSVDENNNGTYAEATEIDTAGLSRLAFDASYNSSGSVTGGVANMSQITAALSASLVVNGLNVSRDSNTVTDLVSGVTLNLLATTSTVTPPLTVANDAQSIESDVKDLVSAYNGAVGLLRSVVTSSTARKALLAGDGHVVGMMNTLRSTVTTTFGSFAPETLGITHSKDGVLQLDAAVLQNYLM